MSNRFYQFASLALFAATVVTAPAALAQISRPASSPAIAARITAAVDNADRMLLPGTASPRAIAANDLGALEGSTPLTGMTLVFSRSAAQQAKLDALTTAQQMPGSPQFHQWLTPAQFGARFGLADSDLSVATAWLQSQGFTVTGVANSRDRITFSGTVAQVAAAFNTELHNYRSATETEAHFAPARPLSVPSALGAAVLGVENLSSFHLRSHLVTKGPQAMRPDFTSSISGSHFLTPGDVAVIYDINPVYAAGFTGSGQIAIVGQSAILLSDITNFQNAAGLPAKAPTLTLVPGSGTSTTYSGDETESDLDIEYSGAIARGATINFIYTGNNQNYGVLDSLSYAINNNVAPIISSSYGACEPAYPASTLSQLEALLQQGAAQGQSIVSASGDAGSPDCAGQTSLSSAVQLAPAVDYPASSKFVTGLGGSEFSAASVAKGNNQYFAAQASADIVTSALSYIPEQVWNDDAVENAYAAGGGGISIDQTRPTWQAGVAGIPSGSFRLVPDVALDASPVNAAYLICASDSQETGIVNSCSSGFRDGGASDSTYQDVTGIGGTSVAAPIFAGMLSILNQAKGYATGQGLVNPTLYTLASNATTYASAFHDITVGGNQCLAGNTSAGVAQCTSPATTEYASGSGYDEASGLGSVDFNNLVTAWPSSTGTTSTKTFSLSAPATTLTRGTTGTATITVTPAGGYTGTVAFQVLASTTGDAALNGNSCYSVNTATVSGTAAATATITIYTNQATCAAGTSALARPASTNLARALPLQTPARRVPVPATLAGLLLAGAVLLRRKRLHAGLALAFLVALGLGASALTGCSSSSSPATPPVTSPTNPSSTTPAGTYVLTIVGQDTVTSTITANTTLTLTLN